MNMINNLKTLKIYLTFLNFFTLIDYITFHIALYPLINIIGS